MHLKLKALIAAMALAMPLSGEAAGLGRLTLKSALGQPLAAEVEILSVNKEELQALTAKLASPDAFRNARVEYAPVLSDLRFSLETRSDGQPVLRITTAGPVIDPFLDMLLEITWPTGRMVREYTMLLDLPAVAAAQTVEPQVKAPVVSQPERETIPETEPAPAMEKAPVQEPDKYGPVKQGETLSTIARKLQPEGVSLDQMLVGLFRENGHAFAGKNMNRLQAGRILAVPKSEALRAIDPAQASRSIRVQSADWHAYRQKLAGLAERQPVGEEAGQKAIGKITPKVEDKAGPPAAAPHDVLKLSKGEAPVSPPAANVRQYQEKIQSLEEEAKAREKSVQEANERIGVLEKSIQDMQRLLDMQEKELAEAQAAKASPAAKMEAVRQPAPQATVETPVTPPEPQPQAEGKPWYAGIVENPLYLGGAAAVVLLGGLFWLSSIARKRRKGLAAFEDSIMTGGEMRAKTVFGSATGGAVNTGDTSFLTEFSQAGLGAIDTHEVDPIAEAEVYMAYGRDAQAEEILKEAMAKNPGRHEVALKLLEIYSNRKNPAAFEGVASELYAGLGGQTESPIWAKAARLGHELDPNNPLYGGKPEEEAPVGEEMAGEEAVEELEALTEQEQRAGNEGYGRPRITAEESSDEMLNLMEEELPEEAAAVAEAEIEEELTEIGEDEANILDFDLDLPPPEENEEPILSFEESETPAATGVFEDEEIIPQAMEKQYASEARAEAEAEFGLDFGMGEEKAVSEASPTAPDIDLSGIELDLGGEMEPAVGQAVPPAENWQEVATKLDLARAYVEMGDKDGAREILEEVLSEGDARQKEDANMLLAEIV
jgi:pilus assembly protein FimV